MRLLSTMTLMLCLNLPTAIMAQSSPPPPFPRLANMYWSTVIDTPVVEALSQWDLVVVDTDWTSDQLDHLRTLNPDIRIYYYVNLYAVNTPEIALDPFEQGLYDYAQANDLWWYDINQEIASDWPTSQMVNVTSYGHAGIYGTWVEFFANYVESFIGARPQIDGLFFDNFWKQISWQQVWRQLDSDCNPTHNPSGCDGVADDNATLDTLWNEALADFGSEIRQRFDEMSDGRKRPLAFLTNNATDYFESVNGTMLEFFPSAHSKVDYGQLYGYNWYEETFGCPGGFMTGDFHPDPYVLWILNGDHTGTMWFPARNSVYERLKRFVLGSSTLGNAYMSLDAGVAGHANLWWEPEYDHAGRGKGWLGQPLGPAYRLLQATGPETLSDVSFDGGTQAWLSFPFGATGTFEIDSSDYVSPPSAGHFEVSSVDPGGVYKLWQAPLSFNEGQDYTLTFQAKASDSDLVLYVHIYSESCPLNYCWSERTFCLDTTWKHYEITFVPNSTVTDAGLNIFLKAPGDVWLDDFSIKEGDSGLFRRDFENGSVLLNYTRQTQEVDLGSVMYRLDIPQSSVFDGAPVSSETVPQSDARFLLYSEPDSLPAPPDDPPSDSSVLPGRGLTQNVPNPFNPGTMIRFHSRVGESIYLAVYDARGRWVKTLVDEIPATPGEHEILWDGRDSQQREVPSGVYFYRLISGSTQQTRKMVLLR